MPLCYGGHISSMSHAEKLFNIGVEKISVNTAALESPDFVKNLSDVFAVSIVVSIDVRKSILGNYKIFHKNKKLKCFQSGNILIFCRIKVLRNNLNFN